MLDGAGYPKAPGGVTACPGLHFVGLNWMTWRKSGILYGVGDDARSVASAIERRRARRADHAGPARAKVHT